MPGSHLHNLAFIYYKKAYDSDSGVKLIWKVMKWIKISSDLLTHYTNEINIVKRMQKKVRNITAMKVSENFRINGGLLQGLYASSISFKIFLEYMLQPRKRQCERIGVVVPLHK